MMDHSKDLDKSIDCTKSCILSSLEIKRSASVLGSEISLDFVTKECLARPHFSFIHALITIYVQHLSFARGLYDDEEFIVQNLTTRKAKIRFLFKMLACVAKLTQKRVDIFVLPVKLLSGQEVFATHKFLQYLAKASRLPSKLSESAAVEILELGENFLYKRSVKTRNTITKIQAIVRGRFTRNSLKLGGGIHATENGNGNVNQMNANTHNPCEGVYQGVLDALALKFENNGGQRQSLKKIPSETASVSPDTSDKEVVFNNNLEFKVSEKGKHVSNCKGVLLEKQHTKFLAIDRGNKCYVGTKERRTSPSAAPCSITEKIQGLVTTSKKLKKCKIINGVVTRQELVVSVPIVEQQEKDGTKLRSINELEVDLKRKVLRIKEREAKLKNMIEETKQKEEHLQMHEERVKRLADNLRKQQNKLKQEGLRHAMEMDKLRLEASFRPPLEHRFDHVAEIKEGPRFSDELLRQACDNPTITDLRLALERKERSLNKRHDRMVRAEKELQKRILEFEEMKADKCQIETKSLIKNSTPVVKRSKKKKKKPTHHPQEDEDVPGPVPILDLVQETNRRRKAFVPATMPEGLKIPKKKGGSASSHSTSRDREGPQRPPQINNLPQSHQLSTISEEGEVKNKTSPPPIRASCTLPRSLINYRNHHHNENQYRNENHRQNYIASGM